MSEITGTLKNWYVLSMPHWDVYCGNIYGDSKGRFPDGTPIRTSPIDRLEDDILHTANSTYKLSPAPQSEWQDIETAPKDGTIFLALQNRDEVKFYECWWQDDFPNWSGWQDWWDNEPKPTHWMPLPAPPEESS